VLPATRTGDTVIASPSLSSRRKLFGLNCSFQPNVNNVPALPSDQGSG